ncbi:MAG: diguanylate cyclase, partial [candidate division WOR-3 bacterium]
MKGIYFDELTDCYNRRFLPYWIDNEIKRANRFATKFGLILLDIDDFRNINNTFGHLEGDNVLIEFTQFIRKNIREVDSLVRYGGDEFIVLVPNTTTKGIIDLAHRILNNINNVEIANHKVTCSIGFAIFPDDGTTMDTLISQADNLMYQAKQQGKNRIGLKQEIIKKLLIPSPVTIGRDDESQWCLNQLQDYNTIFIGGEAGVGKTRLVLELKERLKNSFALRGNAYAALSFVPYHPFKNMFQELMSRDFALAQHTFRRMPDVNQSELMKLLPSEQMTKIVQTEGLDKYRLFNAVKEFMLNIAEFILPNYIILLMDDLHWIDRQSCELLDFLIRSFDTNIKVFGTYRTEEIKHSQFSYFWGVWAREKLYTDMTLSPLNESQSKQLLEAIMGTIPEDIAAFVYQQSGGNPFYIEEILRELDQKKKIYWNGKEWVFVKELAVAIPSS